MKEIKVYVVNTNNLENRGLSTDEEFMNESEKQGLVYSLKGFENAFNNGEISGITDLILIK